MIAAPATSTPPRLGPLPTSDEDDLAAAYPALRHQALTLSWLAEALGTDVARLEAHARAGELLVIPGPWPLRQAYRTGLGYLVPAWQLAPAAAAALPALLDAAASSGWTSLDLHRFMTEPAPGGRAVPAELLRDGAAGEAIALVRGQALPTAEAVERARRCRVCTLPLRSFLRPRTAT
jgi:hypothetical protein